MYNTQSAARPCTAPRSVVATTPTGSSPQRTPASTPVLRGVVHEHTHELEPRVADHLAQRAQTDVAGGPLDDPVATCAHVRVIPPLPPASPHAAGRLEVTHSLDENYVIRAHQTCTVKAPRRGTASPRRRGARRVDDRRARCLLRPVRLRDRHGPVPDLEADARRGAALLQREVRLLRVEPLRRRREALRRLGDVPLRPRLHPRAHPRRLRGPAGVDPLRGPAGARRPPRPAVAGVHAEEDERDRAEGPRVLRPLARPARRHGRLRLRRRPRCADADADDRHAARHPGAGPGGDPRQARRESAPRGGPGGHRTHGRDGLRRDVRGVPRLAGRASVRRPHDRPADGRVRGRDRHDPAAHPRRGAHLHQPPGRGRATRPRRA